MKCLLDVNLSVSKIMKFSRSSECIKKYRNACQICKKLDSDDLSIDNFHYLEKYYFISAREFLMS